ncbi:MAG: US12 family protein [Myxococcales bacterium]|nr:US12 family protein [Myxococcales bacterium]
MKFGKARLVRQGAAHQAQVADRVSFIRRTYAHLAGAIFLFVGLTALIQQLPAARQMTRTMLASRGAWIVVLLLFIVVSWVADFWARRSESKTMQYIGLGLYVVAEVVIFTPLIYIAENFPQYKGAVPTAGLLTLLIFTGLTLTVFITKKDFSFLRGFLGIAVFAALGIILGGLLFGFGLGLWFAVAMTAIASLYILYYTSAVLKYYRTDQHVAASLALFACVALLFWYILQIVMSMMGDD